MSDRRKSERRLAPKDPYASIINPKDLVAQTKLDTSVIPPEFLVELALAFYEGALKYGRFNWRMAPVKASVYTSAFDRHVKKWISGEERDKKTGTHHFAYATCCLAILFDAYLHGTLVDDRPPQGKKKVNLSAWLDGEVIKRTKKLQAIFKDQTPRQFTIQDKFGVPIMRESSPGERRSTVRTKVRKGR